MEEEIRFKCLRCGQDYRDLYDKDIIRERSCPKCHSNSVRPMVEKRAKKAKKTAAGAGASKN